MTRAPTTSKSAVTPPSIPHLLTAFLVDEMSKEELYQVIESQKKEIKYLNQRIGQLEREKEDMIDNFKLSSTVLLERLKDLEASGSLLGERPQTASVLSKISKAFAFSV